MSFFEQIKKEREPTKKYGYQWVTMLIKYDLDGNSEVVRSFSRPAKDSAIKSATKTKSKKPEKKEFNIKNVEEEDLFGD